MSTELVSTLEPVSLKVIENVTGEGDNSYFHERGVEILVFSLLGTDIFIIFLKRSLYAFFL